MMKKNDYKSDSKENNVKNTLIFCTLFNSGYLDKGLVLYDSLKAVCDNFLLYVIAFDEKCYHILSNLNLPDIVPVSLEEFEDECLLKAKSNRTEQEYCWTCSCHAIKYVLEQRKETNCTYIDADMYFYDNPGVLFEEIFESGCDVSIIEHRLIENFENNRVLKQSGRFCIEFNTFFATENGLRVLNWWCDRCIELCTAQPDGIHFGDQKYLDDWEERFTGVHVLQHPGAGVAPWNISQYRLDRMENGKIFLKYRENRIPVPLIFYHFQAIKYLKDRTVDIGINMYPGLVQKELYKILYKNYLNEIEEKRKWLKTNYSLDLSQRYSEKFAPRKYFIEDILGERVPTVILKKLWRTYIRKSRDYLSLDE